MEKILEVNNVTKIYKNGRGVKNINFEVYKGEVFGFLGPNGAGKTTIMKAIVGLNTIQSGTVNIFGTNLHENFEEAIKHVGSIIETADLYLFMTAYNNLKIATRFYKSVSESDIDEILDVVKIKEYKNEKVRNFSLGMKQRLALAIALLSNPKFVILDEPTNGLDIEGTIEMRNLIIKLAKEQQITFFISSHLVHEIELMCSRVAIIHYGELVNNGREISEIKKEFNSLEEFYMSSIKKEVLK
ncbi:MULTISPECIES: ABC transporter ATP-binding protein [unclassified Bacillus (in: firmicutes)]|uniref:ABC transporter ATP-binding protein n=1 Tax=unclassified Bacillus (in: firmicutes) TaxID=185979 RepID=UPI000BEF1B18|nr:MULTISPECIES: ATP-binding cassette domain-containing protein [unclassified Bacillus (in: firmicutes)]PEJ47761.1 ABC transporter [Bacillus sp. AFS002410]PEL13691.1 ABC transporter [Bacillus sp. AFS017336]